MAAPSIFILLSFSALILSVCAEDDIVQVSTGKILGVRDATNNLRFWKGVPFAASTAPPLRFAPPQPRAPWDDVLNCTVFTVGCISDHHNPDVAARQSEDCLNLNIYAPLEASLSPSAALPVMVFIYGGSFGEGDNEGPFDMYDGSYVATRGEVIVVTLNYRLGAFGFLVTEEIGGNFGLMDQRLGMQWVQDNIHVFGGDKNNVTIWGESAGAMSVGAHLISPKSRGLFGKAIMESHVDILYLEKDKAKYYGEDFCKLLNCTADPKGKHCNHDCLMNATVPDMVKAWDKSAGDAIIFIKANWGHIEDGLLEYIPTCCDDEVPQQMVPALESGAIAPVPVLLGTNTNEADTFVFDGVKFWLPMVLYEEAVKFVFLQKAQTVLNYYERFHFHDGRDALSQVFTDYWFRCSAQKFLTAAANKGMPGFSYRYNHLLSAAQIFPKFGLPDICDSRICHATELPLVFHRVSFPTLNVTLTPQEDVLSTNIVDYWTSFAKTGHASGAGFTWPQWDSSVRENIVFGDALSVEDSKELCDMWDQIGYDH